MVDAAEVWIWGQLVGAVRWDEVNQLASFQFDQKFLSKNIDLSPVKMPIQQGNRIHRFPELRKAKDEQVATFKGLPGLLADSLPDRYGNHLIEVWLSQNGRAANSMNPVEQLCFIGARGMGALEFVPSKNKEAKQTFSVDIKSLVEMAHKMMSNKADFSTNLLQDHEEAMREILKIGTSAGGARPKAVIAYNPKTGEVRSGQTSVPSGFEHWLIKLDGVSSAQFGASHGFGRVEYAYYLMAKDCGIEMMECRLLEENERAHFMTKRFDRDVGNIKHHIQTWCGLQHFDYNNLFGFSYEQLFQTMRLLRLTYPEAEQMFRRMVFNVLATNYDDHTKNFSFRLKQNDRWQLAPAYDVCFAYDPTNVWVNQHTLSINGKHKDISKADLMVLAKANSIKKADRIIDEMKSVIDDWMKYAKQANVDVTLRQHIQKHLIASTFS
ncbi:MAG: type II toxin-antitoxin system HipA family toxin [Salibacteraceae bacterium]|nr:type II toxin-antitoxin system HipA family toxin [Salibacteraceae bacterium]